MMNARNDYTGSESVSTEKSDEIGKQTQGRMGRLGGYTGGREVAVESVTSQRSVCCPEPDSSARLLQSASQL